MGLKASFNDGETLFELVAKTEVPEDILDALKTMARRIVGPQEEHNGQAGFIYSKEGEKYFALGSYSVVIDGYPFECQFAVGLARKKP